MDLDVAVCHKNVIFFSELKRNILVCLSKDRIFNIYGSRLIKIFKIFFAGGNTFGQRYNSERTQ